MNWQDAALVVAGMIGSGVAVIHGALVQRLMIRPLAGSFLADQRTPAPIRKLVPPLVHFSTFNWFLGGLALIAAGLGFAPGARLAIGLLVGSGYLYGAIANLWGTRGRHPGWLLYAVAVALIGYGVAGT